MISKHSFIMLHIYGHVSDVHTWCRRMPGGCSIYCLEYSGFSEHKWNGPEHGHMTARNCSGCTKFKVGAARTAQDTA